MPCVSLAAVPRSLRKGLTRRLPRGGKFKDLTGTELSRSTVLGFAGYKGAFAAWLCRCQCGKLFVREGAYLARLDRQGCGCSTEKSPIPRHIRVLWHSLQSRCYNRNDGRYAAYGKLGNEVCKRWRLSLESFAQDIGPRPSVRHVLCRRDNTGDFTPENCFWGTGRDKPSKRVRYITHNGRTQSIAAWADELGISRQAMAYRVNECERLGLDVSLALTLSAKQGLSMKSAKRRSATSA